MLSSNTGIVILPITIPGMLSLTSYITGTVIKKITIPVLYSGFKYNTSNDNLSTLLRQSNYTIILQVYTIFVLDYENFYRLPSFKK